MYLGAGDSRLGRAEGQPPLNPQRLDTLVGKILRIVPDLREHTATSTVSENGRYRIPNDNPFVDVEGARKEIWAYGLRNPHRLIWDVDPARPTTPRCSRSTSGSSPGRRSIVIHKGANYGYPLREGTQSMSSTNGMGADAGRRHDSDADLGHGDARHGQADLSGDRVSAHAGGRRRRHRQRLRLSRQAGPGAQRTSSCSATSPPAGSGTPTCRRARGRRRQPGDGGADSRAGRGPSPTRPKRRTARAAGRARRCPGWAPSAGRGRVDLRFAVDNDGELYILTKSDGMIRKVVGARATTAPAPTAAADPGPTPRSKRRQTSRPRPQESRGVHARVDRRRQAGVRRQLRGLPRQHGAGRGESRHRPSRSSRSRAASSRRTSPTPSGITARATARSSPSSSAALPPTMMAGFDGRIPDDDIWNIVNYLRTLAPKK